MEKNQNYCELSKEELMQVVGKEDEICLSCGMLIEYHFHKSSESSENELDEIKTFLCLNFCDNKELKNKLTRYDTKLFHKRRNEITRELAKKFDNMIKTKQQREQIVELKLQKELIELELYRLIEYCQNTIYSTNRKKNLKSINIAFDEIIGKGKDKVYKVWDGRKCKIRACKVFKDLKNYSKEFFNYGILNECEVIYKVNENEDLLQIPDPQGDPEEIVFAILMPLLIPFTDFINYETESLPNSLSLKMLNSMIEAVKFANEKNLVMCDIKPENCGLDIDGNPFIFDLCAVTKIGSDIKEITNAYQLDIIQTKASECIDLNSIAMSAIWAADNAYFHNLIDRKKEKIIKYSEINDEVKIRIEKKDCHIGWIIAEIFTRTGRNISKCCNEAKKIIEQLSKKNSIK